MAAATRQEYLDVQSVVPIDESVVDYELFEYTPLVGTALNTQGGQIRITIETQDLFTLPCKSYLHVHGTFAKATGALYANADVATMVNNAVAFLFDKVSYDVHGHNIDFTLNPGIASTMKNLVTLGRSDQAKHASSWWYQDEEEASTASITTNLQFKKTHKHLVINTAPKGDFDVAVPLSSLMGFFEDYDKVLYGAKQTLTLSRGGDNDSIFRTATADAGKVELKSVSWCMPQLKLSDVEKERMYNLVQSNVAVPLQFRHWHLETLEVTQTTSTSWSLQGTTNVESPRWIVVGLQTGRRNNQERNSAVFDHCQIENVQAVLNSKTYPGIPFETDFAAGKYVKLYNTLIDFKKSNYRSDDLGFDPQLYRSNFPLVVIDCTKQQEQIKTGTVNVKLQMKFKVAVPANTVCYALVISDRQAVYHMTNPKIEFIS